MSRGAIGGSRHDIIENSSANGEGGFPQKITCGVWIPTTVVSDI